MTDDSKVEKSRKPAVIDDEEKTSKKSKAKRKKVAKKKPGRKKGTPKTGGRKKGTPNRNSLTFRKALDEQKFNLVQEYILEIQMLQGSAKINELRLMMRYLYPMLSEVEVVPHEGPQAPAKPVSPETKEGRLSLIRGNTARKPEASS